MKYQTLNPATEELIETFEFATREGVEDALETSCRAFEAWRRRSFGERAVPMVRAAQLLEEQAGELARVMATEMGKPPAEGEAEARKCAWACRYYAEEAERFLADDPRASDASESWVRHDPLGPILAVMPWNFPFWQLYRFAAPALMAGNAVLLKHARCTPRCALEIERVMLEAGFPEGLVRNLFLDQDQVAAVIGDDRVRGVTLTGSTAAGSAVASAGGRHLKTMVMELGGSDPFVVTEDADLKEAVRVGVVARCQNTGQSCIAAKRFIVHRSLFDDFSRGFVAGLEARTMGDPIEPGVDIGPLAGRDARDGLAKQVGDSLAAGARALCGGAVPDRKGFFYPPTALVDIPEDSPAAKEELFGPVAVILPFDDDDEAIRIANATEFGLGASVWTRDPRRARRFAAELEAGAVFVNGMVKSDPRLPFGGVKASGFGRELSREGILEFVNRKTVWIK
jgi:succinate-semialdehyde dehydrogenase/glutarate-semialdehyde dehydrogenase